jgi:hypothetical protein
MFELTLFDHLRLTFGHVAYRQKAHSKIAHRRARWSRGFRAAQALLMAAVAVTAVGGALGRGRGYMIASAIIAGLSLATLLLHLTLDLDSSAQAHASCAARLWHVREQYRALLTDLSDGAIEVNAARHRRDALMNELHEIYGNAPAAAGQAYQPASQMAGAADETALTDEEIDLFLPKSLHKTERTATT